MFPKRKTYTPAPAGSAASSGGSLPVGAPATDKFVVSWDNAGGQYVLSNGTPVLGVAGGLAYRSITDGQVINGAGAGGVFGIHNPAPWANNSICFVKVTIIGIETTVAGGSGFSYTLEGTFKKDNAGNVTKIAAVTAADDLAKSQRNTTPQAFAAANTIKVVGNSLFVDIVFAAALGKNYNVTILEEYTYGI